MCRELLQRIQTTHDPMTRHALVVEVLVEERRVVVVLLDILAGQVVDDGEEHPCELLRTLLWRRQVRSQVHYASIPAVIRTEGRTQVIAHRGISCSENLLENRSEDLSELH